MFDLQIKLRPLRQKLACATTLVAAAENWLLIQQHQAPRSPRKARNQKPHSVDQSARKIQENDGDRITVWSVLSRVICGGNFNRISTRTFQQNFEHWCVAQSPPSDRHSGGHHPLISPRTRQLLERGGTLPNCTQGSVVRPGHHHEFLNGQP